MTSFCFVFFHRLHTIDSKNMHFLLLRISQCDFIAAWWYRYAGKQIYKTLFSPHVRVFCVQMSLDELLFVLAVAQIW